MIISNGSVSTQKPARSDRTATKHEEQTSTHCSCPAKTRTTLYSKDWNGNHQISMEKQSILVHVLEHLEVIKQSSQLTSEMHKEMTNDFISILQQCLFLAATCFVNLCLFRNNFLKSGPTRAGCRDSFYHRHQPVV